jgi:hypothetical protein
VHPDAETTINQPSHNTWNFSQHSELLTAQYTRLG